MWRCPTCKSKDHLEVVVEMWTKLIQPDDEPENFETDPDEASDHSHDWDESSVMQCTNRGCEQKPAIALEFTVEACAAPEPAWIRDPGFDEECANARLIAAAPDLYAVVEMLAESNRTAKSDADFTSKIALVCEYGKAAIAKVRGEA